MSSHYISSVWVLLYYWVGVRGSIINNHFQNIFHLIPFTNDQPAAMASGIEHLLIREGKVMINVTIINNMVLICLCYTCAWVVISAWGQTIWLAELCECRHCNHNTDAVLVWESILVWRMRITHFSSQKLIEEACDVLLSRLSLAELWPMWDMSDGEEKDLMSSVRLVNGQMQDCRAKHVLIKIFHISHYSAIQIEW